MNAYLAPAAKCHRAKSRPPFSIVVDVLVPFVLWVASGWTMLLLYLLFRIYRLE